MLGEALVGRCLGLQRQQPPGVLSELLLKPADPLFADFIIGDAVAVSDAGADKPWRWWATLGGDRVLLDLILVAGDHIKDHVERLGLDNAKTVLAVVVEGYQVLVDRLLKRWKCGKALFCPGQAKDEAVRKLVQIFSWSGLKNWAWMLA